MSYDFTKFNGQKPSLTIMPGIHEVIIEKVVLKNSKDGVPYLSIWLRLTETRQMMFDIISAPDEKQPLNLYKIWRLFTILGLKLSKKETLDTILKKLNTVVGSIILADIETKKNGEYENSQISPRREMYFPVAANGGPEIEVPENAADDAVAAADVLD